MRLQAVSASWAWIGWPKICPSCIWGRRLWIPGGWKRCKQVHILWLYWFRTSKEAAWGLAHPARDQLIRVGMVQEINSQISACDFWRCMWTSWTSFIVYRFVVIHFENWNEWCKHVGYLELSPFYVSFHCVLFSSVWQLPFSYQKKGYQPSDCNLLMCRKLNTRNWNCSAVRYPWSNFTWIRQSNSSNNSLLESGRIIVVTTVFSSEMRNFHVGWRKVILKCIWTTVRTAVLAYA